MILDLAVQRFRYEARELANVYLGIDDLAKCRKEINANVKRMAESKGNHFGGNHKFMQTKITVQRPVIKCVNKLIN